MQNQLPTVCAYIIDILWVVDHVTHCRNTKDLCYFYSQLAAVVHD